MDRPFINDDFLLSNATAKRLYHDVAAELPIIDYHCHLPPADVATNRQFSDLFEIWLEGDHYKWRAMRANGIPEDEITGSASHEAKFRAWARTVPMTLRNPLYVWSHLELARYFGITELLSESNATAVWENCNAQLADPRFKVHGIFERMRVEVVCTTDDPADPLPHHEAFAGSGCKTRMFPTFRPDKGMAVDDAEAWNLWTDRLAKTAESAITDFDAFLAALRKRHDAFGKLGCRLSDHGLVACPAASATDSDLQAIFAKVRGGESATPAETEKFAARILLETARWNHEKGWTLQLHLGAQRNNNSRMLAKIGRDAGYDSISDRPQAESLAWILNQLDRDEKLPKTILYNLNPADNYVFATMIGNFNEGPEPGKIQFGTGWWFLDQKEAMEWQMNALSNLGLLSRFVGMLTDSRSFLSYPRHEVFRRILCNLLGRDAESGDIPNQFSMLAHLVESVCYKNARGYFGFEGMKGT